MIFIWKYSPRPLLLIRIFRDESLEWPYLLVVQRGLSLPACHSICSTSRSYVNGTVFWPCSRQQRGRIAPHECLAAGVLPRKPLNTTNLTGEVAGWLVLKTAGGKLMSVPSSFQAQRSVCTVAQTVVWSIRSAGEKVLDTARTGTRSGRCHPHSSLSVCRSSWLEPQSEL